MAKWVSGFQKEKVIKDMTYCCKYLMIYLKGENVCQFRRDTWTVVLKELLIKNWTRESVTQFYLDPRSRYAYNELCRNLPIFQRRTSVQTTRLLRQLFSRKLLNSRERDMSTLEMSMNLQGYRL